MSNQGLEHLADKVIEYLDPEDIANCRLLSKCWRDYIDNHRHWYWLQLKEIIDVYSAKYAWKLEKLGIIRFGSQYHTMTTKG